MSFSATTLFNRRWTLALLLVTLWVAWGLRAHNLANVPPGAHYDEAANAILAGEIAYAGYRPLFITSYTGKEVLFFYLAGGLMRLIGPGLWTLRLTAAIVGVLTVAVAYALGRELARWLLPSRLPGSDRRALHAAVRAAGALTAVTLAVNFAHLLFSRLGFRVITQPLLQGAAVLAILVALRRAPMLTPRARHATLALAGVLLGLAAYTYLAVRLFPIVLALAALPLLRRGWRELLTIGGVAAAVVAPLAAFFIQNPATFWTRIGQVAGDGPQWADYAASYGRTLAMFGWQGDPYIRFNIPGLPLFDLLSSGLIVLGLVALAVEWDFDPPGRRRALQIAAVLLVVGATPLMLLPSALAIGEIVPSNLRALGVLPLAAVPLTYGVYWLWFGRVRWPFAPFAHVVALALLLAGGVVTAGNYFGRWANDAALYYANDADLVAIADFLATRPADETPYVAALHYRHPTLALSSTRYPAVKWLPASAALVLPPQPAIVVYPHSSPPPAWVADWLAPALIAAPAAPDGAPAFRAYRLAGQTPPAAAVPLAADFGGQIWLTGYTLRDAAGATPTLRLYWQVQTTANRPYVPFVHVVDAGGLRWAQREADAYPAEQWAAGETIVQEVPLALPPGMPGGRFTFVIGLFDGDERLALRDADGRFAGSALRIDGGMLAGNPMPPAQPPATVVAQPVAPALTLVGYTAGAAPVEAGVAWPLTLRWRADGVLTPLDLTLTATDADGQTRRWQTTQPARGGYPFERWATPRVVIDAHDPVVPADWPAGDYRVTLTVGAGDAATRIDLGTLRVQASARSFDLPPFASASDASFGDDLIALRGYTLAPAVDGQVQLTLVWQALSAPARDYTVFVHLLRPDGSCCIWQVDAQPQQNGYSTGRWLAGEVISDRYSIPLPVAAGVYPLEIGLYRAEDGARLPVRAAQGAGPDYLLLAPLVVEE